MKKFVTTNSLILTAAMFAFTVALPVLAVAQSARAEEETKTQTTSQEKREAAEETATEKKEDGKNRLVEAKLKVCQNREKAITNIMKRVGDRGQKQIDLFTKIAEKTEAFYVKKGKTLSNYDALVADVNAKKAIAQAAVDKTKASVVDFKCDGTDPKGAAASFKDNMKAQNEALKAYKTAVKNLIVGVKSAQGTTSSSENKTGGDQ